MKIKTHWVLVVIFSCALSLCLSTQYLCLVPKAFGAVNTVIYDYGENGGYAAEVVLNLEGAEKEGWQFVGWNTNGSATTEQGSLPLPLPDPLRLYAIYKKDLPAIFRDYNPDEPEGKTVWVWGTIYNNNPVGEAEKPSQSPFDGWTPRGWSLSTEADAEPAESFPVSLTDTDPPTYYGLYERQITLSYETDGGDLTGELYETSGIQYTNTNSMGSYKNPVLIVRDATKPGAVLEYWVQDSPDGTITYAPGSPITIDRETTLYARWRYTEHTITFNYAANGGVDALTGDPSVAKTAAAGAPVELSQMEGWKDNDWRFLGWHTERTAEEALPSYTMATSFEESESDWDPTPIFEDKFAGTSVDMSKWGINGSSSDRSLSILDGRMTMQGGYAYINRDPMVNQALEFDFIKKNQENINSWVMLQFRTNLNSNAHGYEFAILFRPSSGIRYVFPGTEAGLSNQITKVDEPPFNVRVEVEDGYVTVLTKTSPEEEYVRQGDPIYVEALNGTPFYAGFYHMYVTGYIGNVSVYQKPSDVTLYALYEKDLEARFQDCNGIVPICETIYNRETGRDITVPTPGGYDDWEPMGWTQSEDPGTGVDILSESLYPLTEENTGTKFYGLYQRQITLSYNANGGEAAPEAQRDRQTTNSFNLLNKTGVDFELREFSSVSKTGAICEGWSYTPGGPPIGSSGITMDEDRTLYAVWRYKEYPVVFDYGTNGGADETGNPITTTGKIAGAPVELPQSAVKGNGWDLLGWSTDPNGRTGMASYTMPAPSYVDGPVWDPMTVMEDYFEGTVIDDTKWGNAGNLSIDAGKRMIINAGFGYIKEARTNYAVEFDLTKEGPPNSNSFFMLQFRTRPEENYVHAILFRPGPGPNGGIRRVDRLLGGTTSESPLPDALEPTTGTAAGDPPLLVRVEVFNGNIVVYSRHSVDEEYKKEGGFYAETLQDTSTYVGFSQSGVMACIDNVRLYEEFKDVTLYALYSKDLEISFRDCWGETPPIQKTIYNRETGTNIDVPSQGIYSDWGTAGWSASTEAGADADPELMSGSYLLNEDNTGTVFYGLYERQLTLKYDTNGGEQAPGDLYGTQRVNSHNLGAPVNPEIIVSEPGALGKPGVEFDYWALNSPGGDRYNPGDRLELADNTTLFAVWKAPDVYYDGYTSYFADTFSDGDYTRNPAWTVMNGSAEVTELAPAEKAQPIWGSTPIMSDVFSETDINMSDWGKTGPADLSVSEGKMTVQNGYAWINRDAMTNYAVEFDLTKKDETNQDSWFMVQFRTSVGQDGDTNAYPLALMFRAGGLYYYTPGVSTNFPLSAQKTEVDDPPLHVRVEVVNGDVIVTTKTAAGEEIIRKVEGKIPEDTFTYVGFRCQYVKGYIDNVNLYEELPNLVMSDDFTEGTVNVEKWINPKDFTVTDGRMKITPGGFVDIRKMMVNPMESYVLEFSFEKTGNDWFMVQMATPEERNTEQYQRTLQFLGTGIYYYASASASPIQVSGVGTKQGDRLFVRMEVRNGWLTLSTKSSSSENYVQQGNSQLMPSLQDKAMLVSFRSYNIAYLDDVKVYRQLPSESNQALGLNADSRLMADAFKPVATQARLTVNYKAQLPESGKSGSLWLVSDQGAGYGFRLIAGPENTGTLSLEKTTDAGVTSSIIQSYENLPLNGVSAWQAVSVLWNVEEHTLEMYLNGTPVNPVEDAAFGSFTKIVASGSAGVYLDDIRVNSTPETIAHVISWYSPIGALNGKTLMGDYNYNERKDKLALGNFTGKIPDGREYPTDFPLPPNGVPMPPAAPPMTDEAYFILQYEAALRSELPNIKAAGYSAVVYDMTFNPNYDENAWNDPEKVPAGHYGVFLKWLQAAEQLGGIKAGLFLELPGISGDSEGAPPVLTHEQRKQAFKGSLDHLPDSKAVWKINNKPVVMMFSDYSSAKPNAFTDWKNVVRELRETNDFYFIADVHPDEEKTRWAEPEIADAAYSFRPVMDLKWLTGAGQRDQMGMFALFQTQRSIPFYPISSRGYYCVDRPDYAYDLPDFARIHNVYMTALANNAPGVHSATWNDFREDTHIAPSQRNGRAVLDVYTYYNTWLRTGIQPSAAEENVTICYPVNIPNTVTMNPAGSSPEFLKSQNPARGRVYVWSNLQSPHTLQLNDMQGLTLPAGLYFGELPEGIAAGVVTGQLTPQNGTTIPIDLSGDYDRINAINSAPANGGLGFQYKRLK